MNNDTNPIDTLALAIAASRIDTEMMRRLDALTTHTDDCDTDALRTSDDLHDLASMIDRDLLNQFPDDLPHFLDDDDAADYFELALDRDSTRTLIDDMLAIYRHLATNLDDNPSIRDFFSHRALALSLCPMHFCDYAICFDDDDPECATIRALFPSHDT